MTDRPASGTTRLALREVCAARAGDKGDASDISLFVADSRFWPAVRQQVTSARLHELLEPLGLTRIDRYELPALGALKFVLHGALGGGGAGSLRADNLGKTLGGTVLRLEIDLPDELAALAPRPRPGPLWSRPSRW